MDENNESAIEKQKLVEEDYSYENITKNPILKAIAETDRTLSDLNEMAYKKVLDSTKDKAEINKIIEDIPAYQTSNLIARLIKRDEQIGDLVKILNLINRNLRSCIKEVYDLVKKNYGLYVEEEKTIKKINYKEYLEGLKDDEKIKNFIELILEEFDKDKTTTNEKRKFENACGMIYSKQDNKGKDIIAKIMRMEY